MTKKFSLSAADINQYLEDFQSATDASIPSRALQYFQSGEYQQLHKKKGTHLLDGYPYDTDANFEIDLEKMSMLIDYSNDGYYEEGVFFLPLASIDDQNAYIGIRHNDESGIIFYFEPEEGFTEQEYTLDELLKKIK